MKSIFLYNGACGNISAIDENNQVTTLNYKGHIIMLNAGRESPDITGVVSSQTQTWQHTKFCEKNIFI